MSKTNNLVTLEKGAIMKMQNLSSRRNYLSAHITNRQQINIHKKNKLILLLIFCFMLSTVNLFAITNNYKKVKKLTASDGQVNDEFGNSVDVVGELAIVGAWFESDGGNNAGAAYIFEQNNGGINNWGEVKKLTAADASAYDYFGFSVAVAGNVAIVGAFQKGIGHEAGAAYIFERNNGGINNWGEVKKLVPSDAQDYDHFGFSVGIDDGIAVVGAPAGVAGSQGGGKAYIFERSLVSNEWHEVKKLTAFDPKEGDMFGTSVGVSGNNVIVGASRANADRGSAYIFNSMNNWGEVKKLTASNMEIGNAFGYSTAIAGDLAVVSAVGDKSQGDYTGAAYVFMRNQGGNDKWGEVKKLTASDAAENNEFGISVDISTNRMAIVGEIGNVSNLKVYIFDGYSGWAETSHLMVSDKYNAFGYSVGIFNDIAIVGAYKENSVASWSGSAYIYSIQGLSPSETFNSANTLAGDTSIAEGNNFGATTESGEPPHAGNGGPYHSVWWDWSENSSAMAPDNSAEGDTLVIDTSGSDFDTVLAVYTGSAVNNLTQIAANDDAGPGIITSEVTFQFDSGQTYHIAVDGKTASDTGNVVLNYAVIPEPCCLLFIICQLLFVNYWRKLFCHLNILQ